MKYGKNNINGRRVTVYKSKIEGGYENVSISGKIIDQIFDLENINAKKISFFNVQFKSRVRIIGSSNNETELEFYKCEFERSVQIQKLNIKQLEFAHCKGNILLLNYTTITKHLDFRYNEIKHCRLDDSDFNSCRFEENKNCKISNANFKASNLIISNNTKDFEFIVEPRATNDYSTIRFLYIFLDTTFGGIFKFLKCEISDLKMKGISNSNMEFLFCRFERVEFDQFINSSLMKFSGVEFINESQLKITASDLGKTVIFGADFNEIKKFNLNSININEIIYSGVKWCDSITSSIKEMSYRQLREVYKQLKNISSKQNDKIEELRFHSLEMENHKNDLMIQDKKWNDKLILIFNQGTNNHGQSWLRPLRIILVIILPTYFLIKYLLGFNHFSFRYTLIAIAEMVECLNPIRKFTDSFGLNGKVIDTNFTSFAKIIDILFLRIAVGLLIFQMVKAFRKYVK